MSPDNSAPKKLGKITVRAKDKILFAQPPESIPPLGATVGILQTRTGEEARRKRSGSFLPMGRTVDVIGSVKAPLVVVKLDNPQAMNDELTEKEFLFVSSEKRRQRIKRRRQAEQPRSA